MATITTLAVALLSAAKASVNASAKLGIKVREVYDLMVKAGLAFTVDTKASAFLGTLTIYAKSENESLMEVWRMVQDQTRISQESKSDDKKAEAKAILSALDSQWRSLVRYEVEKLRSAQSENDKKAAKSQKELVKEAAEVVTSLLEKFQADPTSVSDDDAKLAKAIQGLYKSVDMASDTVVLAVRQHTFDVMRARKEAKEKEQAKAATQDALPLAS